MKENISEDIEEGLDRLELSKKKWIKREDLDYFTDYKDRLFLYRFGPAPSELTDLVGSIFDEQKIKTKLETVGYIAWLYNSIAINTLFAAAVLVKLREEEVITPENLEEVCEDFFEKEPKWFYC